MGRGEVSQSKGRALCMAALFLTCLLPLVSAAGGGAVLDVSSFSLEDFATTEDPTYCRKRALWRASTPSEASSSCGQGCGYWGRARKGGGEQPHMHARRLLRLV